MRRSAEDGAVLRRSLLAFDLTPAAWGFYPLMFVLTLLLSYTAARLFARLPYGETLTGAPSELKVWKAPPAAPARGDTVPPPPLHPAARCDGYRTRGSPRTPAPSAACVGRRW